MGVGEERIDDFWRWGIASLEVFGGDQETIERGFVGMTELFGFLMGLIGERRAAVARGEDLPEDVLGALVTADFEDRRFTDEEILMACQQLLTAGFETTSTAIANGVHLVCTHPEERRKLEDNPSLLETAVEEILRYQAPVEGLFRTTTEPVEVAGCPIPAGAKVRVMYASANRDEAHFVDAGAFRVDRDPTELRRHLAFGFGPHACLGAALARAEMHCALGALLERLPGLELDTERAATRNPMLIVNGFRTLPVRWDPARARPASGS
jgi:cytochrome P450